MKNYKPYLILATLLGGLWLGATVLAGGRAYALSNSSTTPSSSQPATQTTPATTTLPTSSATPDTSSAVTPTSSDTTTTIPPAATPVVTPPLTATADATTSTASTAPATDPTPAPSGPSDTQTNAGTIDNTIGAAATSGDATVSKNKTAGDATSGSGSDQADLVNTIQSSSALGGGSGVQSSTTNITGNSNGDLLVDPSQLPTEQSGGSQTTPVTENTTNSGTIDNTVDLDANSGDATVENNGTAGSATTGDASAEANIVNIINSSVSASQAFLDTINIYGNLNGNIVLPASLLSSLLANPSALAGYFPTSSVDITNTNNSEVTNAVTLLANSGNASVIGNGTAGNATTGNASTTLNIYNLLNSDIVGGNVLLVFINVSGTWVGVLLNEPVGVTSAAIGGGIQQDTPIPTSASLTNTNDENINNNVYINAASGNALVAYNGQAGNATSGNATASANIVNILGDQIDLSGWLGVLIINVFGSWNGSLVIAAPVDSTISIVSVPLTTLVSSVKLPPVGHFSAHKKYTTGGTSVGSVGSISTTPPTATVASLAKVAVPLLRSARQIKNQIKTSSSNGDIVAVVGGVSICVAALGVQRLFSLRVKP